MDFSVTKSIMLKKNNGIFIWNPYTIFLPQTVNVKMLVGHLLTARPKVIFFVSSSIIAVLLFDRTCLF